MGRAQRKDNKRIMTLSGPQIPAEKATCTGEPTPVDKRPTPLPVNCPRCQSLIHQRQVYRAQENHASAAHCTVQIMEHPHA
jgi:hypothetical protein